ncbi:aldehyde dehydrogenase family protein [Hydrogenophaga sp.]|jgi:acyl-CoA reductase-like NAD-dependent aldehyde dehydrogenase|uniref:aldehyde dehydrogenase family protein n=1 Tax=Hydrogenophaga sp. TaxID=1904254 RepID=UPI003F710FF2
MTVVRPSVSHSGYAQTIDGAAVFSEASYPVINPATGVPFADCPSASKEELDRAVAAASRAFPAWRDADVQVRRAALHRFADAVDAEQDGLSAVLTMEQGKPLNRARDEISRAAEQMRRLSLIDMPTETLQDSAGRPFDVQYRPMGVVGAITPWNMPIILAMSKISHALYTGNTLVLKPSPYTPLATLRLGQLGIGIFPPGVLNVLAGPDELGRWMTEHATISKITFTGSVRTGKKVMASAAETLKRVTLELGGNDAAIVLKDVDPVAIAPRLFAGAFVNSGQVCMAIKRLYVEAPVFEPLCAELARLAKEVTVGDGFDPEVTMGPVQNAMQYRIVHEVLDEVLRDPQAQVLGGTQQIPAQGYFVAPRVIAQPAQTSRVVTEETFGPLLPVLKFDDVDEVIEKANSTRYGLSGSVWTGDLARATDLAQRMDVGTAWVNHHVGSDPCVPFGGTKESGIGRENSLLGLRHYMEPHVVSVRPL